jgi:hypothetical protein
MFYCLRRGDRYLHLYGQRRRQGVGQDEQVIGRPLATDKSLRPWRNQAV